MAKKYSLEKVLYLASLEKPLNVSIKEPSSTDLSLQVKKCIERNFLELITSDDCDHYYRITTSGMKKLLGLQIAWRELNGKDAAEHRKRLSELTDPI